MSDRETMLDSIGMREVAEYASGLRREGGDPVYFVATPDPDGNYTIRPHHHKVSLRPGEVVVPCDTATIARGRPRVKSITITYEDDGDGVEQQVTLDATRFDSLFWSESAVEKFLFPYYASKYQWAAADWLATMSRAWYGFVPEMADGEPGHDRQIFAEGDSVPLAMTHYPRSDYAYVEEGGTLEPGGDVHVLTVEKELRPLSEYRRQPSVR